MTNSELIQKLEEKIRDLYRDSIRYRRTVGYSHSGLCSYSDAICALAEVRYWAGDSISSFVQDAIEGELEMLFEALDTATEEEVEWVSDSIKKLVMVSQNIWG